GRSVRPRDRAALRAARLRDRDRGTAPGPGRLPGQPASPMNVAPVVIMVPGRRRPAANHWQSRLAATLPRVRPVAPLPRSNLSIAARVPALNDAVSRADPPVILVAHSSGVLVTAHWAARHRAPVVGALLATPPDLVDEMPPWHPSLAELEAHGWLPIPR